MTDADIAFHPEAAIEYQAAYSWYASRSEVVAARFEQEIDRALRRISEAPERWSLLDEVNRKFILRRFPFIVVHRRYGDRLWVVAVAHGHRRPDYWKDRSVR